MQFLQTIDDWSTSVLTIEGLFSMRDKFECRCGVRITFQTFKMLIINISSNNLEINERESKACYF